MAGDNWIFFLLIAGLISVPRKPEKAYIYAVQLEEFMSSVKGLKHNKGNDRREQLLSASESFLPLQISVFHNKITPILATCINTFLIK